MSDLNLIFSRGRMLQEDPSGCSLGTLGGLVRESRMLRKERQESALGLAVGPTFLRRGGNGILSGTSREEMAHFARKLGGLGIRALALHPSELSLGESTLEWLESRGNFRFVASNLRPRDSRRRFFPSVIEIPSSNFTLTIFGIVSPAAVSSGYAVVDPAAALRGLLKELASDRPRLFVVLSDLSRETVIGLVKEIPEIHVVVGADDQAGGTWDQFAPTALFVSPPILGRGLISLKVSPRFPITFLENPGTTAQHFRSRLRMAEEISLIDEQIALQSKASRRTSQLQSRREDLLVMLENLLPPPPDESLTTGYRADIHLLSADYDSERISADSR